MKKQLLVKSDGLFFLLQQIQSSRLCVWWRLLVNEENNRVSVSQPNAFNISPQLWHEVDLTINHTRNHPAPPYLQHLLKRHPRVHYARSFYPLSPFLSSSGRNSLLMSYCVFMSVCSCSRVGKSSIIAVVGWWWYFLLWCWSHFGPGVGSPGLQWSLLG